MEMKEKTNEEEMKGDCERSGVNAELDSLSLTIIRICRKEEDAVFSIKEIGRAHV